MSERAERFQTKSKSFKLCDTVWFDDTLKLLLRYE